MSFTKRKIAVTVVLGTGTFGNDGSDTIVLPAGRRVSAAIVKAGLPGMDTADIRVWGMTPSQMNSVTTLGMPPAFVRNNQIRLEAGDDQSGMSIVFQGTLFSAVQDFTNSPDCCMNFSSFGAGASAMKPIPPSSYPGPASVATIMQNLAYQMTPPAAFVNHGVTTILPSSYFPGVALDQIAKVAENAGCNAHVDNDTLHIWPQNGNRDGPVPVISAASGMVGYPSFSQDGIAVRTIYLPGLVLGGLFQLQSESIPAVNGIWSVRQISHDLESETPGGKWFTTIGLAVRPLSDPQGGYSTVPQ